MGLSAKATFRPRSDLGRFVETNVTPGVVASVQASCDLIEGLAKGYAPVDTGRLRDSIHSTVDESGKTVVGTVSTDVDYAVYQEFGTYKMAAQPFMRPAIDEAKGSIKELFRDNISTSMKP